MTRITEISKVKNEDQVDPFAALDLTPEALSTISDEELDELREIVHEIWRGHGSKGDDELAISATIAINAEYAFRARELPKPDRLDKIAEEFERTAITGDEFDINYTYRQVMCAVNLAQHSRFRCMQCSKSPKFEVLWAEGMARAWFCAGHFEQFAKRHLKEMKEKGFSVDIDAVKRVDNREVGKQYGDNKNGDVWPEYKAKFNKEMKVKT